MDTDPIVINFGDIPCTFEQGNVKAFPLNIESIDVNVADGIQPANYRIIRKDGQNFAVIYVGRVDSRQDRGLKDRIIEHLEEFGDNCYFEWNVEANIQDAYQRECLDYHCWGKVGFLENIDHPRKPDDCQITCQVCGK